MERTVAGQYVVWEENGMVSGFKEWVGAPLRLSEKLCGERDISRMGYFPGSRWRGGAATRWALDCM